MSIWTPISLLLYDVDYFCISMIFTALLQWVLESMLIDKFQPRLQKFVTGSEPPCATQPGSFWRLWPCSFHHCWTLWNKFGWNTWSRRVPVCICSIFQFPLPFRNCANSYWADLSGIEKATNWREGWGEEIGASRPCKDVSAWSRDSCPSQKNYKEWWKFCPYQLK